MEFKVLQAIELLPYITCFVRMDKMELSLCFALLKYGKKKN